MSDSMDEYIEPFRDYLEINENMAILSIEKYVSCVRKFLLECGTKFSVNQMNTYIKTKAKQDRYAIKKFLLSRGMKRVAEKLTNPKKKNRKKEYNYIKKEKVQDIINFLQGKYKYMSLLQYKTGCRVQEILTLRIEYFDFDKDEDFIYINIGSGKSLSKGTKKRYLMLHKKYEPIVLKLMGKRTWGYLFLNEEAESLNNKELVKHVENQRRFYGKALHKAGRYFGIDQFSSHYLRHLFADEFYKRSPDITYLQEILGHAKIDTTLSYISITHEKAKDVMRLMEGS